jgi:DNA-binding NtrC family response regulator
VAEGRFREDLFYRLNVIRIHVPPLRERRDDIPLLAKHFLSHYCGKYGKREMLLSADALDAMTAHEWRGNIRELRNLMERCALLATGPEVHRSGLLSVWKGSGSPEGGEAGPALDIRIPVSPERPDLKAAVRELERQLIRIALERTGGSRPKAAELLGISHPTLLYKAKEFGIEGG